MALTRSQLLGIALYLEMLQDEVNNGDTPDAKSVFDGRIPKISLRTYFQRMQTYLQSTYEEILLGFYLIERAKEQITFTKCNLHRLYLSCFRLISKFYKDETYSNIDFAKIAGISISELNNYELELFKIFDYNLFINENNFSFFCKQFLRSTSNDDKTLECA